MSFGIIGLSWTKSRHCKSELAMMRMSQTIPVIYKSQNESDSSKRVAAEAGGRNELLPLPDGELFL